MWLGDERKSEPKDIYEAVVYYLLVLGVMRYIEPHPKAGLFFDNGEFTARQAIDDSRGASLRVYAAANRTSLEEIRELAGFENLVNKVDMKSIRFHKASRYCIYFLGNFAA